MGDMNLIQSFIEDYKSKSKTITLRTSGSTGESKVFDVEKHRLKNSALRTLNYFNLRSGDKVLMCMSPLYIGGKMMLVRALEGGLELLLGPVTAQPLKEINKVIDFVAMVPLQFKASSLEDLNQCKQILLGGAPVDQECLHKVKQLSNSVVYESFGMTETLSHFAIKNLSNGDLQFTCLEGVNIRTNNNSCLEVFMEGVTDGYIITKDIVSIVDNRFEWKGRFDFLINSGGVKIIPEELEQSIRRYTNSIKDSNFFLAGISDTVLGQKMILVVEGEEKDLTNVLSHLEKAFGAYKVPKSIHFINEFKWTKSGKIDRLNTLKLIK